MAETTVAQLTQMFTDLETAKSEVSKAEDWVKTKEEEVGLHLARIHDAIGSEKVELPTGEIVAIGKKSRKLKDDAGNVLLDAEGNPKRTEPGYYLKVYRPKPKFKL